jgi:CBS domain-containing protein
MAATGLTRLPVVDRGGEDRLVSVISLSDLLHARVRALEAERERERTLRVRAYVPRRWRRAQRLSPTELSAE